MCSTMYLYWEENIKENYYGIKYSLCVLDVGFKDFINSFRNVGGAQAFVANINFQEELFIFRAIGEI